MLLAIDTSSLALSCALAEEDRLIAEWTVQRRLTHSEQLIPHIEALLTDAGVRRTDITAVAVSKGPGSFTGLRIGLATAKTMALIWKVPLIGVDTLEALAWNLSGAQAFICPMVDAQRGNVYTALYGAFSHFWLEEKAFVASAAEVIAAAYAHGGPVITVGDGADLHREAILEAGLQVAAGHQIVSRAGSVAMAALEKLEQGERDDPMAMIPNYVRRSEAEVLWEKRHPEQS